MATKTTQRPVLTMFAGPNGPGKSTLTKQLISTGYDLGEYINPDDIATTLEGAYDDRVRRAQFIADRRRHDAMDAGRSFAFETVMSHPSKLAVLERARGRGFLTTSFFVGTEDPVVNLDRVAARVEQGGHAVPADRVVARWYRTMSMAKEAISLVDRAFVFDNTTTQYGPRLVLSYRDQGASREVKNLEGGIPAWVTRYIL